MNIHLDLQTICLPREFIRGIPYYTIEVTRQLLLRANNRYTASVFDYKKERNNIGYIDAYLSDVAGLFSGIYECNDLNYKTVLEGKEKGDASAYNNRTYYDYIGVEADICHFFHILNMPHNIEKHKAVVTAHDIMPFLEETRDCFKSGVYEQFKSSLEYLREQEHIRVIAVSESTKNDLVCRARIPEERISVIYEAFNRDLYYEDSNKAALEKYGIPDDYILYLGALDPRKGIDTIMRAEGAMRYKDIPIVLAGNPADGYALEKDMEKAGNPDRFILTGYVTDEEKRQLLSHATVFVFPSTYEGFGLPVLEAMACGAPVVTTNVSSLPEVGGDAVCYINPGDDEQLANVLDELLSDCELRNRFREKGKERCKQFSWEDTAAQIEALYQTIN